MLTFLIIAALFLLAIFKVIQFFANAIKMGLKQAAYLEQQYGSDVWGAARHQMKCDPPGRSQERD